MSFPIEPLYDRVLVEKDDMSKSESGLFHMPDTVKGRASTGTVVAVGPGRYSVEKGEIIPITLKAGDRVFVKAFDGYILNYEDHEVFVFTESEIIGKIS